MRHNLWLSLCKEENDLKQEKKNYSQGCARKRMTWSKKRRITVKAARGKKWPKTGKEQLQSSLYKEKNDLKQKNNKWGQGKEKKRMTWNKKIIIAVKAVRGKGWSKTGKEQLQSSLGKEENDLESDQ